MKKPTFAQANQVLNLIAQKQMPAEQLQKVFESGLLSDLLDGNIDEVDRMEFRRMMGLNPLTVKHIIDLDADPFVPEGWKVEEHQKGGQLVWCSEKVKLYLSPTQEGSSYIGGNKLRKELKRERVMNANLLDYLLSHQELIPKSWKGQALFFWGTIYRNSGDRLCVRYLFFLEGRWYWDYSWLGLSWDVLGPAVVAS